MRYRLRNQNGDYFCASRDCLSYKWVPLKELRKAQWEGVITYVSREAAEREIPFAQSPKERRVGNRKMIRPDYPDMAGARVVSVR